MVNPSHERAWLPRGGAILVLLLVLGCAPALARAEGCAAGDHRLPLVATHFDRLTAIGAVPGPGAETTDPAIPGTPCRGGICSGKRTIPPPVPPPLSGTELRWGCLTDRLTTPWPPAEAARVIVASAHAIVRPATILRPPRSA